MVWLTCKCLNLKIHVKTTGTELTPIDPATVGVDTPEYTVDDFFTKEVCLVQLDLEGVKKEYDCLIREKQIGDWTLSKCLNCQTKTHAIHLHQGDNRVLVSTKLEFETTVLKTSEALPEYSPLYEILIPGRNDNQPTPNYGPRLGRFEAMQQESLIKVQQQLNTYLITEEAAMEERIRLYEEHQRAAFSELQSKARWDKTKLISVALSVEDQEVSESLSEAMTDSPLSPFSPLSQETSSSSASSSSDKKNSNMLRGKVEHKPTVLNLTRRPVAQPAPVIKSPEADGLFDMEFDDVHNDQDTGSFYESDEEDNDNDTDDSSYSSDASMRESLRNSGHQRPGVYSQSVPMNVPMWSMASQRYHTSDSPDDLGGADDIGASIKALAMSVRVDGTEIFGDLPRGNNKQFKTVEIMKRREKCRYTDESQT